VPVNAVPSLQVAVTVGVLCASSFRSRPAVLSGWYHWSPTEACPDDEDAFAVGTSVTGRPRTDPDERVSRIRLLPRVFDGKANAGLPAHPIPDPPDLTSEQRGPPTRDSE
jgi:hypothetical protein